MAVNVSRSMSTELHAGSTDGKYRKVRPNTSPINDLGDAHTLANRGDLHPYWNYGHTTEERPAPMQISPA